MDFVRVGYFIPLNGPLNGHPPSIILCLLKCISHTPPLLLETLFLSRSALLIMSPLSDSELKLSISVLVINGLIFSLSLPIFPFIRGEVLPVTFSPPHLLLPVFLLSSLLHISLNTVLPSQPWPPTPPPLPVSAYCPS